MELGQPEGHRVAVRGYAISAASLERAHQGPGWEPGKDGPRPSGFVLLFDTETTVDAAQRLRVGAYQLRRDGRLLEAGFFSTEDGLSRDERKLLQHYVASHRIEGVGLELLGLGEFTNRLIYRLAYQNNGLIAGFNLPFDISRIAYDSGPAKRLRDGFTFHLGDGHWPLLQVKHLSSKAAIIRFEGRKSKHGYRGFFCDVHTLAAALLGESHGLGELADLLGTKTRKGEVEDYGAPLSDEFLDYAMGDVQVTWECLEILKHRYESHGLSTPISSIYSEASIGKAYLNEIGIHGLLKVQPSFPQELIGHIMSAYHGGRTEVHVRRKIMPVAYLDFLSQYTTCCVLMGLWRFVIARDIGHRQGETERAQTQMFLDRVTADDFRDPARWRDLVTIVKVRPDGDLFPVRTKYANDHTYTTGLNYLTSEHEVWFALADCVASKLLTGKAPRVLDAVVFEPGLPQENLQPVDLAGNPDFRIEPTEDDFYKRLIELRSRVKREVKDAERRGDEQLADRLQAEQQALKVTASATSYGIFIELNVERLKKETEFVCFGPEEPFSTHVRNTEKPGRFFHPLLATLITGAARLLLALAELRASAEGLGWVLCDTDSMTLAQPETMADHEFVERVRRVGSWFQGLSPYAVDDEVFKLEDENFALRDGKPTDEFEKLYAFAISAKRYCLFNRGPDDQPVVRRGSAHGLGYLHPPYGEKEAPLDIPAPAVSLRDLGLHRWQYDLWYRIVQAALSPHPERVNLDFEGFDKPAGSHYAATSPELLGWFSHFNDGREEREQVQPFGFLLAFQVDPLLYAEEEMPRVIAPYDSDPLAAAEHCFDRKTGAPAPTEYLKTYLRVLAQYHLHPEAKFLNANFLDTGTTIRRHVLATDIRCIGKEANRWDEQAATGENPEAQTEFIPDVDVEKLRADCRPFKVRELARESGVSPSAVSAFVRAKGGHDRGTLVKLRDGAERLSVNRKEKDAETVLLLKRVRELCEKETVSGFSRRAMVDRGTLQAVVMGRRGPSRALVDRLWKAVDSEATDGSQLGVSHDPNPSVGLG